MSPTPDTMDASFLDRVREAVPGATIETVAFGDMPTAYVDRASLVEVCRTLRDHADLQFAFLAEVTAVDLLPAAPRFEVVYHLACLGPAYGTAQARRLRLKVRVAGDDARLPTVSAVWAGAGWPEREVFDLFGIAFEGHADLRRVLMPDDWEGHPLRKDYPVQIRKDTANSEPLQLTVEQFAANVRAAHQQAAKSARVERG